MHIPTLLVSGQNSPGLFHHLLERLEELLPQSESVEIPGASHIVHEDTADAYDMTVLSFLKDFSQPLQDQRDMP